MNRFMKQVKKNKLQAHPEVVKLWGTGVGRNLGVNLRISSL